MMPPPTQVAEVRSRFEGQEGGIEAFLAACKGLGLACRRVDKGNKMFFLAEFVKEGRGPGGRGEQEGVAGGTAAVNGGGGGKKKRQRQQQPGKGREGAGGEDAAAVAFHAKACLYKRR